MSTAEIIAELPRLSPEELAQVQAKLSELVAPTGAQPRPIGARSPRTHSPRLADSAQVRDFAKQVV